MKTLIIAVSLVIATLAFAQTTKVTVESDLEGNENVCLLHCEENAFLFAQYCEGGWSQAYAGVKYSPKPYIEVAVGAGAESGQDSLRFGGWIWAGKGRFSAIRIIEDGGSGAWQKTSVSYQISNDLSAGYINKTGYGDGVTVEYKLNQSSTLTGAVYEGGKATVSLSHSF